MQVDDKRAHTCTRGLDILQFSRITHDTINKSELILKKTEILLTRLT